MKVTIGSKVTQTLPSGLRWPAVAISEETSEVTTITSRTTGLPVDITVTRADFISLRETREGDAYLALTNETVQYGYRPVVEPRFNSVVGLDATEEGAKMSLQDLMDLHGVSYAAFQAGNFEARREAVSAADL